MSRKPLGIKNYGSIPHLPNSRMGPGDHSCHEGQARIATEQARDRHDKIIIQEKLDGSNVGVAKIDGMIVPLQRAGYRAETSPHEQHKLFADWVQHQYQRFDDLLNEGERVVGEWLAQAHGTRYELIHEAFVAFDLMVGVERLCFDDFKDRVLDHGFTIPFYIPNKYQPMPVAAVMDYLGEYGHHGALEPIEGAIWRVERKGKVDFLVKYVRPDKQDGKYLPVVTGGDPVWNWMCPKEVV